MAANKKTKKKSKVKIRKTAKSVKKRTTQGKTLAPKKRSARAKPLRKKPSLQPKTGGARKGLGTNEPAPKLRRMTPTATGKAFPSEETLARSASQSGDLQGLSDLAGADSESVDELIEEGNAFEADVIAGVEEAGQDQGKEVRTHEVPEDDVPDEYLEND